MRNGQMDGRKFRRQHPVGRFVLDYYCHAEHLAVEIDGAVHQETKDRDAERQQLLESIGIRFLRLPAVLIEEDLNAALRFIREAIASRKAPLSRARERGRG